jgi:hypothetical protein
MFITTSATAQHFDIGVRITDGTMQTESLGTKSATAARVFPAYFGDTGVARFTSNPGIDAAVGTFTPGTRLGFNALSGLRRFSGNAVEPVTTERLEVKFLTLVTLIGNDAVNGFDLAVQSNGGYHRHLNFTLKPEAGQLPASGIYVAEFELYSNDGVTLPSAPFFIVFNDGRSSTEHEEAIAWVAANLLGSGSNCPADFDGDGEVGASDLAAILGAWGTGGADLDGDGETGAADLSAVLAAWGACD